MVRKTFVSISGHPHSCIEAFITKDNNIFISIEDNGYIYIELDLDTALKFSKEVRSLVYQAKND